MTVLFDSVEAVCCPRLPSWCVAHAQTESESYVSYLSHPGTNHFVGCASWMAWLTCMQISKRCHPEYSMVTADDVLPNALGTWNTSGYSRHLTLAKVHKLYSVVCSSCRDECLLQVDSSSSIVMTKLLLQDGPSHSYTSGRKQLPALAIQNSHCCTGFAALAN